MSSEICRHYTIYLPPNQSVFDGKLSQLGGKFYAYTGGGNGLHRAQKVLTSVGKRPYTHDEMSFGGGTEAVRRRWKDIRRMAKTKRALGSEIVAVAT